MVSTDNLKKGLLVLGVMLLVVIGLYATLMIGGLVVGSIAEQATAGTVSVSSAMNTSIAGHESQYITDSESIADNSTLIIGLVAIVVIMLIFGFKFSFGKMGSGKSVE